MLLCCVALWTSTANVTQSLSSSFSRARRSGTCDRRIRRRSAIFRSISLEDTRGFLKRRRDGFTFKHRLRISGSWFSRRLKRSQRLHVVRISPESQPGVLLHAHVLRERRWGEDFGRSRRNSSVLGRRRRPLGNVCLCGALLWLKGAAELHLHQWPSVSW